MGIFTFYRGEKHLDQSTTKVVLMKRIMSVLCLCVSAHLIGNEIETWSSPPETISSAGLDASDPHLGMAASGDVVAAWLESGLVVSRSKALSNPWDTLATLSGSGATSPQLAVDPSGNATAVWVESGSVKTADKLSGGSWSSATSLSTSNSSDPQIAVRSNGDLVAVWIESGVVKSKTKLFGGSWSTADTLSASGADSAHVAIGDNGDAFVVWHSQNGISLIETIYAANRPNGGSWSAASTISNASENSVQPQIAVDPSGNATAIWYTYSLSGSAYFNVALKASSYSKIGFAWETPVQLPYRSGKKNPSELQSQILYSQSGLPVASWTNSIDGATFQIVSSQRGTDGVWTEPFEMANSLYAYSINMAVSSVGNIFAAYMNYNTASSSVVIETRESQLGGVIGGGWTGPFILSTGTSNGFPGISAVVTGGTNSNAAAAWLSFDGSNNILQAVTGTGTLVIPPSSPGITQSFNDFGIFQEYYNTITWSASTDPNLVGYIIYRNNDILAFIETDTLKYVDNNQAQNGSVVYGVSAIDYSGAESAVVTVSFP